jgi:hypothetical protein
MKIKSPKIRPIVFIVLLIVATFFCQQGAAGAASVVNTDKEVYNQGEAIKVKFSNSPGNDGDWICIVPDGSPDTEGGDYKYLPKGLEQGSLTFDPPGQGKYEARAYYNYQRNGYVVSGRAAFSVEGNPDWEAAVAQRMERKMDPQNPLEGGLPQGNGLVYILREPLFISSSFEPQMKADEKPIVYIRNSSYFLFSVPAGDVVFTSGDIRNSFSNSSSGTGSMAESKVTIKIKPSCAYYLKVKMIPKPFWSVTLEQIPHQEGAASIKTYQLTILEK